MVATLTAAAGSGFTSRIITSPDGDLAEDKMVTTAGSNSATATLGTAGPWVMQMVTFSAVSGPVPTVSSVSPNSGSTAGGTAVTITGTNFAAGATVTFGGTAATNVVVVNSTTITATTPAGSAGAVTVTVTNPSGQSGSLASGFTYVAPPTVSSVSPNSGSTAGGTAVTITGTNFAAGATVTFGGTAATNVVVVNSTTITATTPAGSAGAVTVTVTNSNGQSGSLANGFTYVGPPTVSSVSPNSGIDARWDGGDDHGDELCRRSDGNVWRDGGDQRGGGEQHDDHGDDAGGQRGSGDGDGDQPGCAERESDERVHLCRGAHGEQCVSEHGSTAGGTAVTITGTNFAAGATVTFGGTAATQRGGGEQHDDYGDDAGACGRSGDGDGDGQRAERQSDQRIHLRCSADGEQCQSE